MTPPKRGPGRPPKPPGVARSIPLTVRLSPHQHAALEAHAKRLGYSSPRALLGAIAEHALVQGPSPLLDRRFLRGPTP